MTFEEWAKDHLGQGYSLEKAEGTYINPVTRWAAHAYAAGQRDGGQWRMSVDEALIQHGLDCTSPDSSALEQLTALTRTCHRMAVDPAVSADAAALVAKGRVAGLDEAYDLMFDIKGSKETRFDAQTAIRNRRDQA